ncbi:MAG: energy transducer TonB, partial [Spongiibacteraceae bacterium]
NQLGSGTQAEKVELSSKNDSEFHDNKPTPDKLLKLSQRRESAQQHELLSAHRRSAESRNSTASIRNIVQPQQWQGDDQVTELSSSISSLEAQLKDLNQSYARMPKPKFITSVATRGSPDALYLDRWEERVEAIGNANYPKKARSNNIEGELRLLLMLMPSGAVDEVRILKSSGHNILDRAALQIVRKAAPYEAIPTDVLDGKNRLGIVRTWRFEQQSLSARNR